MSRYIATRAIRGANALVTEAELMLNHPSHFRIPPITCQPSWA
jgi:hypothetical protein